MTSSPPGLPTSVPRWSRTPAVVDEAARTLTLLGVGRQAAHTVRAWTQTAAPGVSVTTEVLDDLPAAMTALDEQLARAVVGWRLMLAGSEAEVAALLAHAVRGGAEESEIRSTVVDADARIAYCPHCRRLIETAARPGDQAECGSCGAMLIVRPHFSARLGAYLAVNE